MPHYHGIDYGMGSANVDPKTGIRFGVIPLHALGEFAPDEFEADYGDPTCPECGRLLDDYQCRACRTRWDADHCYPDEPIGSYLDEGGYKAELHSDGDVFVILSPYYTHAQYCSPCAPGACYLLSPVDPSGPRAYCLGHEWFDSGKAPYPVWRVADGKLVRPEKR